MFNCHLESAGGIDRGHGLWTLNRDLAQWTFGMLARGFRPEHAGHTILSCLFRDSGSTKHPPGLARLLDIGPEITSPVAAIAAMRGN
jgi:hypothetical protein